MMLGFGGISSSVHSAIEELVDRNELSEYVILVNERFNPNSTEMVLIHQFPSCVWDFELKNGMISSEEFACNIFEAIEDHVDCEELTDPNVKIAVFKIRAETVNYHKKPRTMYFCDMALVRTVVSQVPAPSGPLAPPPTDSESDDDDELHGSGTLEEAVLKKEIDSDNSGAAGSSL